MKNSADSKREMFKDKEYRHAYVDEFLNASIATQMKVLREQRGWSQKELAKNANMKQPRISVMENVNYSSWSINILKKLAEAFDVALYVSFESFGKRFGDVERFGRKNLERPSFDDDPFFSEKPIDISKNKAFNEAQRGIAFENRIEQEEEFRKHRELFSAKKEAEIKPEMSHKNPINHTDKNGELKRLHG